MAKKKRDFRLSDDVLTYLDNLAKKKSLTVTDALEYCVRFTQNYETISAKNANKKLHFLQRVLRLKYYFLHHTQSLPTEVLIPSKDEIEFERLTKDELGELVGQVTVYGARSLKMFLGLQIVWDAESLAVTCQGKGNVDEGTVKALEEKGDIPEWTPE